MALPPELIAAQQRVADAEEELNWAYAHGTVEDIQIAAEAWKQSRAALLLAEERWLAERRDKESE